jgi:hypothetical protein
MKSPDLVLRWTPSRKLTLPHVAVLWPVHVWPVVAPDQTPALNLFQSAILGLARAGKRDLAEIAELLELDRDLVRFIATKELQPSGWLDQRLCLTTEGVRMLDGDGRRTRQFAFQDAVFGHWWPRLSADLPEIEAKGVNEQGRLEFVLERGSGHGDRPTVLPVKAQPRADLTEVLQALRRYRSDLAKVQAGGMTDTLLDDVDVGGDEIEFCGDTSRPQLAHVWCEVYANPGDPQPWLVSDPWRFVPAVKWLREPLQESLGQFPELAGRMRRKLMPDEDTGSMSAADWLAQLELRTELDLASMPHLNRPEHAKLREHMGRVLRQRDRLRRLEGVQNEEMNSLLTECGALMEATVQWMLKRWPIDTRDWPSKEWDRRLLGELLQSLPLQAPLDDSVLKVLCGQKLKDIRLAIERRDRPFKALWVAALLCSREHDAHPLRELPVRSLQWGRMLELTDLRNKGSHASGQRLDHQHSLDMADFAVAWHEQFIPYF